MPSWRRAQNTNRNRWLIRMIFLGSIVFVLFVCRFIFRAWYENTANDRQAVSVTVKPGDNLAIVAQILEDQHVLDAQELRFYARFFDDPTVYPGDYSIPLGVNYHEVMAILHGPKVMTVRLTIPEGFTLQKIGERVREVLPSISLDSWNATVAASGDFAHDPFILSSGKPDGVDLEGYLFPDTYEFAVDATAHDVVNVMLRTMEKNITSLGIVTGDAKSMSLHEILTLASIVEREVRSPETMQNVADIFLKRLAIGMALQSDATVNYVIDGDDPSPTFEETRVDSLYNTYLHPGLPPGPISSPGFHALTAVFHPIHNEYYYFLTTNDGEIYYAETYEEHLENKYRYL